MNQRIRDFGAAWPRLEVILEEVLDRPHEQRRRRARQLCAGDARLFAQVEELLAAIEPEDDFLPRSVAEAWPGLLLDLEAFEDKAADPTVPDRTGEQVGDYQVDGVIGRGGMGDVYLAHRADGAFDKRVAIKIARQKVSLARDRLSGEQRILADLDHPNIARLLDAGLTSDALPYVVMEYVDGQALDTFCVDHDPGLETRLRLFLEICAAVDHAHRRLVIHRDLKPSNILVGSDPSARIKLLDFGIAKLLDPQDALTLGGTLDGTQTLRLTPGYAAPEQFLRGRLSTATDVYALGIILFELLSGARLRDREVSSPSIWIEQVLRDRPPFPSARAVDRRQASRLRGDLDAIVLKALEPDPEDRYQSAQALAEEIERHLDGRPVQARATSLAYRADRFLRRYWLAVGAVLLVFISILGGAVVAVRESRVADEERRQAQASAARAENISQFLVELFSAWDPYRFRHGEVSARDLLDLGTDRARSGLEEDPQTRGELLLTLAEVHLRLGLVEQSEGVLKGLNPGIEISLANEEQARLYWLRGQVASMRGDLAEAEMAFRRALDSLKNPEPNLSSSASATASSAARRVETLIALGDSLYVQGRHRESEDVLRRALSEARAARLRQFEASSLASLGGVVHGGKRYDETLLRQALDIYRSPDVVDPQQFHATLNNLSIFLIDEGRWQEATEILEELTARDRDFLGPSHPTLAQRLVNLARLHIEEARFASALDLIAEAKRIYDRVGAAELGVEPLALDMNKGRALAELGRPEALKILRDARQAFLMQFGEGNPILQAVDVRLAEAFLRLDQPDAALDTLIPMLSELEPENRRWADARAIQGASLVALERHAEAEPILEAASESFLTTLPPDAWRLAWFRLELATCRARLAHPDPFDGEGGDVLNVLETKRGRDHYLTRRARLLLRELDEDRPE